MTSFSSEMRPLTSVQLLLIDDDASLGRLIAEYASFDDYVVTSVQTGTAGLNLAKNRSFALMILDVMLPDMDGFQVLRRLRLFSDVPVVMLTTRGAASDRVHGLTSGADDYLPKPFEPDELLARINAVLRRVRPTMHGLRFVAVGDLELDERSRRVTRRGEAVKLTGAEFSLLQILVTKAGTILPRQDLIPLVLNRRESIVDRSIDSLVSNLRRKLGPLANGDERIQSVRGTGYVYIVEPSEKLT